MAFCASTTPPETEQCPETLSPGASPAISVINRLPARPIDLLASNLTPPPQIMRSPHVALVAPQLQLQPAHPSQLRHGPSLSQTPVQRTGPPQTKISLKSMQISTPGSRCTPGTYPGANRAVRPGGSWSAKSCCSRHPWCGSCPYGKNGCSAGPSRQILLRNRLARRSGTGAGWDIPGGPFAYTQRQEKSAPAMMARCPQATRSSWGFPVLEATPQPP